MIPRRTILIFILLISAKSVMSQKNIKGLINAEKQFAWFTSTHTVKEGFLQYMDSSAVIFQQGTELNALAFYKKQNAGPGILSWEPSFAVISASGDMGATAGPSEFRAKSMQDTPIRRGTFCSVWRINRQGEWKNIADIGCSYKTPVSFTGETQEIILPKTAAPAITTEAFLLLDKNFNIAIQEKNIGVWMSYISPESHLNTEGNTPAVGMLQIADALQKIPPGLQLSTKAGELSSAGDFGYTYGVVQNGTRAANYLRIWIYRNKQWQVIVQTIKW